MTQPRKSHSSITPESLSIAGSRRRFLHTVGSAALWGVAQGSTLRAIQAAPLGASDVSSSAKTTSCFYGPVAVGTSRGRMM